MTVTALRACCDYVTWEEYREALVSMQFPSAALEGELDDSDRRASFTVRVVALLDDGRQLTLGDDRGFSVGPYVVFPPAPAPGAWSSVTGDGLEFAARSAVEGVTVADVARGRQPLARELAELGVEVSSAILEALPLEVVLSDRLRDRLGASAAD